MLLVGLLHGVVHAATYYVATNGSDSNPGSQGAPFRTIAHGLRHLQPGDTLYLRGGTYAEPIHSDRTTLRGGTSWTTAVTIASAPGETATVAGAYLVDNLASPQFAYLILDRLVLDGGLTLYAHHVRVQDSEIKNSPQNGIMSYGSHLEFLRLDVHHNGVANGYDHGIYHAGSDSLIADSHIWANGGYGIHVFHQSGGADRNLVVNNRVHDNLGGGGWSCGMVIATGEGNQAAYNEVYNEPVCGLQVGTNGYAGSHRACANTIRNTPIGIKVLPGAQAALVVDNQFTQVGTLIEDLGRGTQWSGSCAGISRPPSPRPPPVAVRPAPRNLRVLRAGP